MANGLQTQILPNGAQASKTGQSATGQTSSRAQASSTVNTRSRTAFQTKIASEHWLNLAGKDYRLVGKSIRIGRALDNDIIIDHKSASRYHAIITMTNDRVILEDLKSRNGIKVNSIALKRSELKDNDHIRIGDLQGVFFQRAKKGSPSVAGQAPVERSRTLEGASGLAVPMLQFDLMVENLKERIVELFDRVQTLDKKKKRQMILIGIIGIAFLGFALNPSSSRKIESKPDNAVVAEESLAQGLNRHELDKCIEHEDLGNYRQAVRCLLALPNTVERRNVLGRVQGAQRELADKRFQEGVQALENLYYDIAIFKFQEVTMVADESSELITQANANIMLAEQRRRVK